MPYKALMNLTNIPSTQRVPPEAPNGAHLPKSMERRAGIYLWEPPRTAPTQLLCCTTNPRAGGIASRADKICSYIPIYRSCFSSLILPLSGVVEIAFACVACTKGCMNKGPADASCFKAPLKRLVCPHRASSSSVPLRVPHTSSQPLALAGRGKEVPSDEQVGSNLPPNLC